MKVFKIFDPGVGIILVQAETKKRAREISGFDSYYFNMMSRKVTQEDKAIVCDQGEGLWKQSWTISKEKYIRQENVKEK